MEHYTHMNLILKLSVLICIIYSKQA